MTAGMALFLVVAILLPMVPAYLLYKLLPSSADLEGPWQGLKIKVGGAFGGYFLLVVTILGYSKLIPTYDVWTVRGRVEFADAQRMVDDRLVRFTVRPSDLRLSPSGDFSLTLFRVPDPSGGAQLPTLIVDYPNYMPMGLDLERSGTRNAMKRLVELSEPITLQPSPVTTPHEDE